MCSVAALSRRFLSRTIKRLRTAKQRKEKLIKTAAGFCLLGRILDEIFLSWDGRYLTRNFFPELNYFCCLSDCLAALFLHLLQV